VSTPRERLEMLLTADESTASQAELAQAIALLEQHARQHAQDAHRSYRAAAKAMEQVRQFRQLAELTEWRCSCVGGKVLHFPPGWEVLCKAAEVNDG